MRGVASVIAIIGLAGSLWWGLGYRQSEAEVRTIALDTPIQNVSTLETEPVLSDEDRRLQLNQRMQDMIRTGEGARLQDPLQGRRQPQPQRTSNLSSPTVSAPRATAVRYSPSSTAGLDLRTPPLIPDNELECLTQAIYYEARNESEAGQAAVAEVVMNRVRHASYPNQVCAVVYQRNSRTCQFTFTCDGSIGRSAIRPQVWARAQRIARDVYEGRSDSQLPRNSVNYHANYVRPSWGQRLDRVRQIGAHIFYGSARGGGQTPGGRPTLIAPTPQTTGSLFVRNSALDEAYARHVAEANGADQT